MQDIQPFQSSNRPGSRPAGATAAWPKATEKCQIVAKKGFLSVKKITSGVALLVYSSEFQLGVLLHLSPSSDRGIGKISGEIDEFAKPALDMILSEFEALGVMKADLRTYAIGGSAVDGLPETSVVTMRRALWCHGLVLSAFDLGGHQIRSIWMDVESGRTIIRSEPMPIGEQEGASLQVAS